MAACSHHRSPFAYLEGLLAGVDQHVPGEEARLGERLVTDLTERAAGLRGRLGAALSVFDREQRLNL